MSVLLCSMVALHRESVFLIMHIRFSMWNLSNELQSCLRLRSRIQSAFFGTALSALSGRKAPVYALNLGHWLNQKALTWCACAAYTQSVSLVGSCYHLPCIILLQLLCMNSICSEPLERGKLSSSNISFPELLKQETRVAVLNYLKINPNI